VNQRELVHDFGGDGPIIHLAHANGFPPASYGPFAQTLIESPLLYQAEPSTPAALDSVCDAKALGEAAQQTYHVIGLPARPLWPRSQPESAPTWHTFADDLIAGLDELGAKHIIGLGHSMGGAYTLLAAVQRPDLFRALVLIDPVIMPPRILAVLWLMRRLGLSRRQPLVQGALRRRRTWPDRQACYNHYRSKRLFADWPETSLRAYVEAGMRLDQDGQVTLVYPPEWEAHIFATAPTDIWRYVPKLAIPLLVIRGERSDTFRLRAQRRMARLLPGARFVQIPGAGHLVPMERPAVTAAAVLDFLAVPLR
jgi:pimeloyl-ACP methyl ester carboxylesterase